MKLWVLNSIPTTLAFTLASTITFSSASNARELTFFCGTVDGEPAIIAETPQGNIPAIRWVSSDFLVLGINSRSQCEEMAQKLQKDCARQIPGSQQTAICSIIQGGSFDRGNALNFDLETDDADKMTPLWGSDIQLSKAPETSPMFPVCIQMNVFLNGLAPAVAVPGDPNIFAAPPSGDNIKREPEPAGSLW
ncbi:MAG: COP23 domain-containing protein [Microcoleus sp.]|uniref:COP23 domain-containing protein n=1 Tax=unclassified Microcoleus TaxID=2642155 RepID=UPI0018817927|nr:hypothetical protein [Microcoleus sp. LEGE 07076]